MPGNRANHKCGWAGRMGTRAVFLASVSTILIVGTETTLAAQDEETNVQNLPPIEVSPPRTAATREQPRTTGGRARPRTATQIASPAPPKQKLYVYPTAPGPGSGIDVDKI